MRILSTLRAKGDARLAGRLGTGAFLFFLIKGLAWLAIPWIGAWLAT